MLQMLKLHKTALICGITGQDGAFLAQLLLKKGYHVHGTSRDVMSADTSRLTRLGVIDNLVLHSMIPDDFRSVFVTLKSCQPDEVYFLAGQTSVGRSFDQPSETMYSITFGLLNLLEAIRQLERPVRLYNASSSECFGDTGERCADESTSFSPCSPYAVAKASANWLLDNYRNAYGIYACNGILYNHESYLRPDRFVTQKIITAARRIAGGSGEELILARLDIRRDWGWAPEYVEAMWRMLQQDQPEDYVIATGEVNSLESFVDEAFRYFDLNWREHVRQSESYIRPTDPMVVAGNPEKAKVKLGWSAKYRMKDVVRAMIES